MPKPLIHTALFHLPHQFSHMLAHAGGDMHMMGAHQSGTFLVKAYAFYFRWIIIFRVRMLSLSLTQRALLAGAVVALPLATMSALFLMPKSTTFSLSTTTCYTNIMLFPRNVSQKNTDTYKVTPENSISVAGYPLLSTRSCVELIDMPAENSQQIISLRALGFMNNPVTVTFGEFPKASVENNLSERISPRGSVELALTDEDTMFSYQISLSDKESECSVDTTTVACPLQEFNLKQGETYPFAVTRSFNDESMVVAEDTLQVQEPIIITGSSIVAGETVQHKPENIVLTTNKPIDKPGVITVSAEGEAIPFTSSVDGTQLTLTFSQELPRSKQINISIKDLSAVDGAYLDGEYTMSFQTSGGPSVTAVNIGTYDVLASKSIVITFDSTLAPGQDLASIVSITNSAGAIPASITASGNSITINPNTSLDRCSAFSVNVKAGLVNTYGVGGGSAWGINSRTSCKQIFSIGSSVQGRALTAYRFGSGSTQILYVGGLHGNEKSSYRTLIAWVDELERNYQNIPANVSVVVIPDLNPDGYAASSRTNANQVDLNRNFPTNDWQPGVYMPGNVYSELGGGSSALSEPESAALASYINSSSPSLVLTYHAVASSVFSNGVGNSYDLAKLYGQKSGLAAYSHLEEDGIFSYPTTGELETWLYDKKGIRCLLIELNTMSSNEINSQRSAMWAMLSN